MTLQDSAPPSNTAGKRVPFEGISKTLAIAEIEIRKIIHDPAEILARSLQPFIWLMLYGEVMAKAHLIPVDNMNYLDYLTPGILAQSIMFVAIFYGIAVIWEKDLGIVQKLLVTPTPRIALVSGKALSAGFRSLSQVLVIYLLSTLTGVTLSHSPFALLGVMVFTLLTAGIFATFSLIVACLVKTRERFMGIGQIITMPLFFASNAMYPLSVMPLWIKGIAFLNPLTYAVDAFRVFMLKTPSVLSGIMMDFFVLLFALVVLLIAGAGIYPKIAR